MSDSFTGSIILFAGNFPPRNWAFCNGQIINISQNPALFSILGTTYGGNGQTTFALPDLRGRVPLSAGQGPGLSSYVLGQASGTENVTLLTQQIPLHNHALNADNSPGTATSPSGGNLAQTSNGDTRDPVYTSTYTTGTPSSPAQLSPGSVGPGPAGGGQPHTNIQPILALNYIICLSGIFPSRN